MTPNPASVEQIVMERRLSVLSGSELAPMIQQSQVVRKNSDRRSNDRSPRSNGSGNKRRTSSVINSSPQVVKVPMPAHPKARMSESLSPKSSILLAPPVFTHQQEGQKQRRFSEVNVDPFNDHRRAAKRSQSVMYRQGGPQSRRRQSRTAAAAAASRQESVPEHGVMQNHRRQSVRM